MIDKKAKIKEIRDLGSGNFLVLLETPEQARLVRPGQFVMVKCREDVEAMPLLRRPFSVFDVRRRGKTGKPAGIDILVKIVGTGSRLLAQARPGETLMVLGPQGKPFPLPDRTGARVETAYLVAGGVGIAALYLLAAELIREGTEPVLFYGGRTRGDLVLREPFENLGMKVFYATEDGSHGTRGLVTDILGNFLKGRSPQRTRMYACGPWGMMRAASQVAARHRIPCLVSLEARMGCSLGACMGCVVRGWDDAGEEQYLRVCLEGPVMDSRRVDWDTPPL